MGSDTPRQAPARSFLTEGCATKSKSHAENRRCAAISPVSTYSRLRYAEPPMEPLLFTGVAKAFDGHSVFRDLTVAFSPGKPTLLLGANGSGKSTLLRLAAGLTQPDGGIVAKARTGRIGYSGHRSGLYPQVSVLENLTFFASLNGAPTKPRDLALRWELDGLLHRPVSSLSKGLLARASLCAAMCAMPHYLFLDEPSSALDDRGVALFSRELAFCGTRPQGDSIVTLIATHDISRLLPLAQRVVVLEEGIIFADSGAGGTTVDEVLFRYREINR